MFPDRWEELPDVWMVIVSPQPTNIKPEQTIELTLAQLL